MVTSAVRFWTSWRCNSALSQTTTIKGLLSLEPKHSAPFRWIGFPFCSGLLDCNRLLGCQVKSLAAYSRAYATDPIYTCFRIRLNMRPIRAPDTLPKYPLFSVSLQKVLENIAAQIDASLSEHTNIDVYPVTTHLCLI